MTLEEIKSAVIAGKKVCWKSPIYEIYHSPNIDQWLIFCTANDSCIGLTHADGVTLNGKPEDFQIYP